MLLKVTGKILLDRNICIVPLFYCLHGDIVPIVIVTTIDIVTVTILSKYIAKMKDLSKVIKPKTRVRL